MRLTERKLRQIVKEEFQRMVESNEWLDRLEGINHENALISSGLNIRDYIGEERLIKGIANGLSKKALVDLIREIDEYYGFSNQKPYEEKFRVRAAQKSGKDGVISVLLDMSKERNQNFTLTMLRSLARSAGKDVLKKGLKSTLKTFNINNFKDSNAQRAFF